MARTPFAPAPVKLGVQVRATPSKARPYPGTSVNIMPVDGHPVTCAEGEVVEALDDRKLADGSDNPASRLQRQLTLRWVELAAPGAAGAKPIVE